MVDGNCMMTCAVAARYIIWIKARPDFDVLFQLLNNLRVDEQQCFWIAYSEAKEDACDIREDFGQEGKVELAQRELSDLGRRPLAP